MIIVLKCNLVFFFSNSSQGGRFSEEGIQQIGNNGSFVQCTSSHLTSFSVLVDATGESVSCKW